MLVVVLPFLLVAAPDLAGADHSYVVLSSSMSPSINAGDVVFVSEDDPTKIRENDVITFNPSGGPLSERDELITHRVVNVTESDGTLYFETKGDANDSPDAEPVPAENVVGRVTFTIPFIGHVVSFASSGAGTLLLIVVPAVLLGLLELRDLYRATEAADSDSPK
nr:signal peptidase I [Halorientalis brevis]